MNEQTPSVHLWWADARELTTMVESDYHHWLTKAEQHALQQKILPIRRNATLAKLFLKSVLASYVKQAPGDLRFSTNAYGKPHLADAALQFNLSHSEHYFVLAVSKQVAVGVDVQVLRQDLEPLAIAARFFHREEHQWLSALTQREQHHYFYRLWSAKEAVLKAAGVGIGASGLKEIVFQAPEMLNASSQRHEPLRMDVSVTLADFHAFHVREFFTLNDCALNLTVCAEAAEVQMFQWHGAS